jgi:hypothetical protein
MRRLLPVSASAVHPFDLIDQVADFRNQMTSIDGDLDEPADKDRQKPTKTSDILFATLNSTFIAFHTYNALVLTGIDLGSKQIGGHEKEDRKDGWICHTLIPSCPFS